ncbi:MAG: acyl-CoA thioesterase [Chitinophagaceae bacterium]|nr:acyl-CoA thioesterase [Bacteroidota bacterium]MCC6256930.1 acyl-CoA thioesterase [Chitinophagaceae bacterium]MCW5916003.1 acyl-CoA thioesterase [Ferruginibacter sp.]
MSPKLTTLTEIQVRFNEADPLGIVWHGHYIRYFEDGREAFGKMHGLSYLDVFKKGFVIPVVEVNCHYKKSLKYGDTILVETIFIPSESAKMKFNYRIFNKATNQIVATGNSIQVFLDKENQILQLNTPEFFNDWKNKYGLS